MTRMTNRIPELLSEVAIASPLPLPDDDAQDADRTFEAALPVLLELAAGREPSVPLARLAAGLHRAITDRLVSDTLESNRLSRDLHDRTAPAIAAGLRNLELFELYRDSDPAQAELKLAETRQSLCLAFDTARDLAARSRRWLTADGLPATLRSYLRTVPVPKADLHVVGDPARLPSAAADEIFLVLREAVRNAVTHADPRQVRIGMTVTDREFHGQVSDDGAGFDPARSGGRIGLSSMAERAELLGGNVRISSRIGTGTCVELRVPLPIRS